MMTRVAKFEKVSYEQFKKDWLDTFKKYEWSEEDIKYIYDSIKLPKRATSGSAGYDFYCPCDLMIDECDTIKIPTGIRCQMQQGWALCEFPRSGHGFKYGLHLANTVAVIDEDYYYSDNEGHIFIKLVNDNVLLAKPIEFKGGDAFCQGVLMPFGITIDDDVTTIRNGGFGSTNR